jgi:hypothetical protein
MEYRSGFGGSLDGLKASIDLFKEGGAEAGSSRS